jgi:hypothetical protein
MNTNIVLHFRHENQPFHPRDMAHPLAWLLHFRYTCPACSCPASHGPGHPNPSYGPAYPNLPPSIQLLTTGPHTSLRGLSAVNDKIIWVSGSSGTVGKSLDGGKTWTWITVPGYEKRDFRDIEAFDAKTAIIMAIAEPADILKTTDGGKTWKLVYENTTPGMFLDAMEFWNINSGIVVGDPVNGRFFVTRSFDGGDTWHDIPFLELPKADSGEGCFASSGTNVRNLDRDGACFVSGGPIPAYSSAIKPSTCPSSRARPPPAPIPSPSKITIPSTAASTSSLLAAISQRHTTGKELLPHQRRWQNVDRPDNPPSWLSKLRRIYRREQSPLLRDLRGGYFRMTTA